MFRPADAAEAGQVIAWAAAETQTLEIVAGGSKRALGRLMHVAHTLDVSRLSGVIDYDAAELVLTAHAATPMAEIGALLAGERQMLAFEPPDMRPLLGSDGEPTLGGTIACNLAGPRRVRAGSARDHFLGFAAVNGFGDSWKSGGRVVKNVTGYDMCKLQAGAFGTLSLLTELTVRVVPAPERSCSVLLAGLSDDEAVAALSRALNTPHEVSAAAHLPMAAARRSGIEDRALTVLRIEGHAPSVAFRADALAALFGSTARLDDARSVELWTAIGQVRPLLDAGVKIVWCMCPTPASSPAVVRAIRARLASADAFYDWGGGLVWLCLDPDDSGADAGAAVVRAAVRDAGGHATLIVAPDTIRAATPVFEPAAGPLAALGARIKQNFDPRGVLNPGRMNQGA